jgi:phosphoribosylglycinamide formyltransferase-1
MIERAVELMEAAERRETDGTRLGVLISGRGSNLQAIIDAVADGRLIATIAIVISNNPDAGGLERARRAGIETAVLEHTAYRSREAYDEALVAELQSQRVHLVCLAGFMRLLSPGFVEAFPERVLNVHPSLLPAFPGLHGQRQAWNHGVKVTGATVHIVTPELDAGPIVLQAVVPVEDADTADTLAARILVEEHRIYPEAIGIVLAGGWRIEGRRFVERGDAADGDSL